MRRAVQTLQRKASGDFLVADTWNHRVLLCPAANPGGACSTVAGSGGQGSGSTQLDYPFGVAVTLQGVSYLEDVWSWTVL